MTRIFPEAHGDDCMDAVAYAFAAALGDAGVFQMRTPSFNQRPQQKQRKRDHAKAVDADFVDLIPESKRLNNSQSE